MIRLRWGAATDTGRVRTVNEDSVLAIEGVFAVADGMGGHAAGEVASSIARDTVREALGREALGQGAATVATVTDAVRAAKIAKAEKLGVKVVQQDEIWRRLIAAGVA